MGLDLVNIARTGVARCGLARLNAGEVRYSTGAVIGARPDIPDNPSGILYQWDKTTTTGFGSDRTPAPSVDGGILTFTYDLYRFFSAVPANTLYSVRIKRATAGTVILKTGNPAPTGQYEIARATVAADEWVTISGLLEPGATFAVVFGPDGVQCQMTDWYIGDGTYLYTNSLTASGSGYVTVNPYYGQASGQAVTSGVALSAAHYKGQADGQAAASGSALYAISYAPTAQGQADTSGAADYTTDYTPAASGQLDASGDASGLPCYLADAGGQLDTSGTAPGFPEMIGPAGGEATLSGLASPLAAHYRDTTGGAGGTNIDGTAPVIFTIDVKGLPVFVRRFDGDVRLTLSETGGIIRIRGGQPEMDDGLTTAVNISLLSEGDWWGNALAAKGEDIGSGFLAALNAPLTNRARLDIIEAARSALAWLTETGIAQAVDVSATIPSAGQLALTITIRQPERSPSTFRYTVNWAAQRIQLQEIAA